MGIIDTASWWAGGGEEDLILSVGWFARDLFARLLWRLKSRKVFAPPPLPLFPHQPLSDVVEPPWMAGVGMV